MPKTRLVACGVFSLWVLTIAAKVCAAGVVCPVCGQVFDESTPVCPNDGTDLKLLGKPATQDGDIAAPSNDTVEKDTGPGRGTTEENAPEASAVSASSGGYKRHEADGERKVLEEADTTVYSDRLSRLPTDTRTVGPARRKRANDKEARMSQTAEENAAFFSGYDKKRRLLRQERRADRPSEEAAERERALVREQILNSSTAPLASVGARFFFLGEGRSLGWTGGAEIDFHFVRRRVRAGASAFLGIRNPNARKEPLFLERLSLGAQLPGRFSPFIVAKGGIGALATNRFRTDLAYLMTSIGIEAGVDAWINPWLVLEPSFGFERYMVKNAYWNSFTWKLAVGF
jgi:hypothetical protein